MLCCAPAREMGAWRPALLAMVALLALHHPALAAAPPQVPLASAAARY